MSASPSQNSPWPAATPSSTFSPFLSQPSSPPSRPKRSAKRRRIREYYDVEPRDSNSRNLARQVLVDPGAVDQAKTECQIFSGNNIISCFPNASTIIPQHQWASFVWNSRRPELTQTDLVDVYLFRADSLHQILHYQNLTNPSDQAGMVTAQVNDTWFGANGSQWNGQNITYPFFWIISRSDEPLDGSQLPQTTFNAVQTTFADSVVSSMASTAAAASASAASASAASLSSLSAHGSLTTARPSATGSSSNGSLQPGSSSSSFPHWAIAVIVVLGFLAIAATCVLAFLIIRRIRNNSQAGSNRNSIGSASPMMAHTGNSPQSPLLAGGIAPARQTSSVGHGGDRHRAPSVVSPDGASTISRANSAGDQGPFSGADAAIMADAFRKALRKPDFAGRPVEEGESPEHQERKEELLNRELAEEGRDIRSVSSSRGVKVETLSDNGDTVQDNPH